eukprot:CAMPEP_0117423600 /NCGR_PEP_ID=MMETSP0758-20121206/4173_1 /TAXON_ID=63605 /ORGANISM="Percolomonas cosmopolitus, Strain AE-1 (ATCC 50343)" /LENGTH=410 /DNA_ID=CAMNT_0005206849 /DNA_START=244 /DNA_END=1476 /DNA_ORIENTATION=-
MVEIDMKRQKSMSIRLNDNRYVENAIARVIPKLMSMEDKKVIQKQDFDIDTSVRVYSAELDELLKNIREKNEHGSLQFDTLVKEDLDFVRHDILESVSVTHPVLKTAAEYFLKRPGKLFRPMIVLLLSRCVIDIVNEDKQMDIDGIMEKERKLAEVTEIMHVASLIHDDIIDESDMRRGIPTLHKQLKSTKIGVLGGDFLLARASIILSKLGSLEVIEKMSTIIEHLAHGEILQIAKNKEKNEAPFDYYMRTIYFKTASIIAHSCESAVVLANGSEEQKAAAYEFGKHLGIAYQLIDDVLDFTEEGTLIGKPSKGADLRQGIATSPVLFAALDYPAELNPMIKRRFSHPGDADTAMKLVEHTDSISKTRDLAVTHCKKAVDAALRIDPSQTSPHLTGLLHLMQTIMQRRK